MRTLLIAVTFTVLTILSTACSPAVCPASEPVRLTPPDDEAVSNPPTQGYYFANEDNSILASAWWVTEDAPEYDPSQGIKVGWFRPAGETLVITGRRLDGSAPPLQVEIPCCYPTRFQATGLYFPTSGCWEITATAGESTLTFVVTIEQ